MGRFTYTDTHIRIDIIKHSFLRHNRTLQQLLSQKKWMEYWLILNEQLATTTTKQESR